MSFDIMLPFWGEPAYLYEAVESVLLQDSPNWRLTVVDDCYGDPTVSEYFNNLNDSRVRYIVNEKNLGVSGNFTRSVELATQKYMMVMGCDDRLAPNYVSNIEKAIKKFPDVDIIQPGVRPIGSDSRPRTHLADKVKKALRPSASRGARIFSGDKIASSLLTGDWLYWPSLTFRRETLASTPFRKKYNVVLDLGVIIDILVNDGKLAVLPEVSFYYRRHIDSVSSVKLFDDSRFAEERAYFKEAIGIAKKRGWKRSAFAARLHVTSRLHALSLIPRALKDKNCKAVKSLLHHTFSP